MTLRPSLRSCVIAASLLGGLLGLSVDVAGQGQPRKVLPKVQPRLAVEMTAQPKVITPGQSTHLKATVTYDGNPVPGAEVVFEAGGGLFGSSAQAASKPAKTGPDGVCTDRWTYQQKTHAMGYVLIAKVTVRGETARDEVNVRVIHEIK